ncbi:MAG: flagellar hook-associated protein FlgL [Pseudomonadota bacterium]
MRVATKTLYDNMIANLDIITEEMNSANETVATGKRINKLSDDPVGLTSVLNLHSARSNIEQLHRNINTGRSWLNTVESALISVDDLITDAKTLCVQMTNATVGSDERQTAATNVQNYLDELKSLANTDVNGRYIFAGSKTDTAPFDFNATNGIYNGDDDPFSVKIGKNMNTAVGRDGETVFGANGTADDIFKTLIDLKTALQNNDVSGVNGIQAQMDRLENHFNKINTTVSDTGQKVIRLDVREGIIGDLAFVYTERLSKLEDADMVEAIMELKKKETTYQAALSAASKVMQVSLVDYL